MLKQSSLDQIKADILAKNICPDLAKTATNLVMGVGSPNAQIMFIGEAPGKNEDLKGEPFVGAAGKFLDEMLAGIGLKREDVYITNIVKYRPPNNRDPLPEEKKAFWPYLLRQVAVIQPKVIVTLGRHSMEYFLPGRSISQIHGQPKRITLRLSRSKIADSRLENQKNPNYELRTTNYKVIILPLFHPAAALYNNGMRQTLIDDFMSIPSIIKQIKSTNLGD